MSRRAKAGSVAAGGSGKSLLLGAWFLASMSLLNAHAAFAQADNDEEEAAAEASQKETREQKLAREFSDPLTTLPQIFVQDAYTPANYGTDAQTNKVIARAIIPRVPKFSLLPFVQLIRPSVFLNTVPTGKGSGTRTEFGDMQLFDVAVVPWNPVTGLRMGVGPLLVFPTATDKSAGQRAWQAGPTFGAIYKGVPWLLAGWLIQNPISFAYTSHDSQAVSTLLFQPVVLLSVSGGWYVKSADSLWTMGWRQHTSTVLPVSFGIGRVILREGLPPLNLFVTGEWTAYRQFAPVAPQTTVRFGMTMAFPDFRPWH